jgi:hypothetical protein
MALCLKVPVVEPEDMPSFGNSKHVPAAMNNRGTGKISTFIVRSMRSQPPAGGERKIVE